MIRIAWVGHRGKRRYSDLCWLPADSKMEALVQDWLFKNKNLVVDESATHDYIDLNCQRDFLKEKHKYDIVVLCFLFNPVRSKYGDVRGACAISEKHNVVNWRKRLIKAGAKYIFAFGSALEVSGKWLGEFGKYKKVLKEEPLSYLCVWEKLDE